MARAKVAEKGSKSPYSWKGKVMKALNVLVRLNCSP
jgi:hypothetical protein